MNSTYIETIDSGKDKAETYSYQMSRYKLATKQKFFFEAIVIAYAMIEDRLLAFLHYAGVIDRRIHNNRPAQRIYVSAQCQNQINTLLKRKTNDTISLDTVNIKIRIIKALLKLPEENNDQYLDLVRTQIDKTIDREELNKLLQRLNIWLNPRNQIIHALMGKRTKAVLEHQAGIAKDGYQIGRDLDSFVARLKKGNEEGIRIAEDK